MIIIRDIPIKYIKFIFSGSSGLPLNFSIAKISKCPPSKIGIGRRLNKPINILKIAVKYNKFKKPNRISNLLNSSWRVCKNGWGNGARKY